MVFLVQRTCFVITQQTTNQQYWCRVTTFESQLKRETCARCRRDSKTSFQPWTAPVRQQLANQATIWPFWLCIYHHRCHRCHGHHKYYQHYHLVSSDLSEGFCGKSKVKERQGWRWDWERLSKRNEEAYDVSELRGILVIFRRREEGGNVRRQEGGNVE